MTPCIAALPGGERPSCRSRGSSSSRPWPTRRGRAPCGSASTSSPSSRAASAATPSVSWKPWLNQPRLISSLPRGAEADLHRLGGDLPADHPGEHDVAARCDPSFSPSASAAAVSGLFGWLLNVAMSSFSSACDAAPLTSVANGGVVLKSLRRHRARRGAALRPHPLGEELARSRPAMPANWLPSESSTRLRTRSTPTGGTSA